MPRTYRRRTGYLSEQERGLHVTTVDRPSLDLEVLARVIVDLAMAETAPVKPLLADGATLQPNRR